MKRLILTLFLLIGSACAAIAQSAPWFIGLDGGVYKIVGNGVQRVGLGTGSSLAVRGQEAYLIGTDNQVWRAGRNGDWQPMANQVRGQKICVTPSGALYVLGTDGGVYRFDGRGLQRMGVGSGSDLAVDGNGALYLIGTDGHVWESPDGRRWGPYNPIALGKRVAVSLDGRVYVIGTDGGVYSVERGRFNRLGLITGQEIAVSSTGQVSIVGTDNGVYLQEGRNWNRLGAGTARQISWPR